MLSVHDNTKTFVDRFLENVGADGTDNENVTDAIIKHYNETIGNAPGTFHSVRATIINSSFSKDGGDDDIIVIIVVVIVISLCFVVAILFYLRKRKMEKQIAVEVVLDDIETGTTKM